MSVVNPIDSDPIEVACAGCETVFTIHDAGREEIGRKTFETWSGNCPDCGKLMEVYCTSEED